VRVVYPEVPPRVEYSATPVALRLLPVLRGLGQWMLDNYGEIRAGAPESKDQSAA
jgi:DNA-binding HxlR family transcriptional regulator